MAHGKDKYKSRQNRFQVRKVLMCDWDPIGVSDVPEAQGEYDSYVGRVYVMLMDERATCEEISRYLLDIAVDRLLTRDQSWIAGRCDRAAAALIALRPEFDIA